MLRSTWEELSPRFWDGSWAAFSPEGLRQEWLRCDQEARRGIEEWRAGLEDTPGQVAHRVMRNRLSPPRTKCVHSLFLGHWRTQYRAVEADLILEKNLEESLDRALESLAARAPRSRFFFKMLAPVFRFGVTVVAAFAVIHTFAPTPQAMVAITASFGIALGFGAQDLVKNLLGGLIILTDRPYQLGDRVQIGDAYGEVDHIGLRSTKITNPDDTRVTIPNSEVLNGLVSNANSGVPDCQVVTDLFVPITTEPEFVLQIAYEAAYSSPYLLHSKPVVAMLADQFQDRPYSRVRVKAYVYDHRYEPRLQSDITVRAKAEFLKRGILKEWRAPVA